MQNMNKKGFTIVELVIVIAVIAILAAVMIPTFSGIIKKANESAALQEVSAAYKVYQANSLLDDDENTPVEKIVVTYEGVYIVIENGEAKVVDTLPTSGYETMEVGTVENEKCLVAPASTETTESAEQ